MSITTVMLNRKFLCPIISIAALVFASACYGIGPRDRILPNRPNPPGPNNHIGPNNPAISNPLSSLNPNASFSNNQIVLRQLLLSTTQNNQTSNNNLLPQTFLNYSNSSIYKKQNSQTIPASYQLLLNNRSAFTTNHPVVFDRPNPLTPLSNDFTLINGRYFKIDHNPANNPSFYVSNGYIENNWHDCLAIYTGATSGSGAIAFTCGPKK